ncbi:MAG: hypothetical protein L3K24_14450 [Gammaproteobacteria bacterium]|nr:hypothetical protein [Gammaproteobacteria bacterium]
MDTKPMEEQAESFVKHELIKHKFNVVKPCFDEEGADLLIIDNIKCKFTNILKVQSKGRSLNKNGSSITIPISYVKNDFVVFLYVVSEALESTLFTFFYEDIVKWKSNEKNYILNFTNTRIASAYFAEKIFTSRTASTIRQRLNETEIKKYTTIIIDEIFLEKAISKTISIYKEIYPKRNFCRPTLKSVIIEILAMYDNFDSIEKEINCHVYNYESDSDSINAKRSNIRFLTDGGVVGKIFIDTTDEFVWIEIVNHMKRIINTENIILVADDIVYEQQLNEMKEKMIDVTLVQLNTDAGRRMFTEHKWGDITFPIAKSIGLGRYEW